MKLGDILKKTQWDKTFHILKWEDVQYFKQQMMNSDPSVAIKGFEFLLKLELASQPLLTPNSPPLEVPSPPGGNVEVDLQEIANEEAINKKPKETPPGP